MFADQFGQPRVMFGMSCVWPSLLSAYRASGHTFLQRHASITMAYPYGNCYEIEPLLDGIAAKIMSKMVMGKSELRGFLASDLYGVAGSFYSDHVLIGGGRQWLCPQFLEESMH